jgi:hypothetical protein
MEMWVWRNFYIHKPFQRFTLPRGFALRRDLSAREILITYLSAPEIFWSGPSLRQAEKVRNALQAFKEAGVEQPGTVAERLLDCVQSLRDTHYRPFFVMGAGSSGSTWLGAMLGDLPGFCYGREIYLPSGISYLYRRFKNQEMADLIWTLMLLPSWGFNFPEKNFAHNFVNSGRSISHYDIYREIWPAGRFIFLVRDPRDQLLAATYRKPSYRQATAPHADDLTYLQYKVRKFVKRYRVFKRIIHSEKLYMIRYEQLKNDTVGEMRKLCEWAQVDVAEDVLSKIVYQNNAQNMRAGLVPKRGNLDEGGIAKSWREVMTEQEKKLIMPSIQEALKDFGYE